MSEEQKQDRAGKDPVLNGSDEDRQQNLENGTGMSDPDCNNSPHSTNELNSKENLRQYVVDGCEVEASDVWIIEQLPEDMCQERSSEDSLETIVLCEYSSELDEDFCSRLPPAYFDNTENRCFPETVKVLNVKDTHSVPQVHGNQTAEPVETHCQKNREKAILRENTKLCELAGNFKASLNASDEKSGERKYEKALVPEAGGVFEGSFVPICEFAYLRSKKEHNKVTSDTPKQNFKFQDYSSDEFADVEDNLIDSSTSDSFSSSSSDNSKESLVRNEVSTNKSDDKSPAPNFAVPSCSYAPLNKITPMKGFSAVKQPAGGKNTIKGTMATIVEETESENEKKPKPQTVSKTNPLIMKTRVGQRKDKCNVCNARLGLCGIRCRCGGYYCSKHRYDKEHDCTFDYKSMGAEEIRKNNPRVVAEKVRKL